MLQPLYEKVFKIYQKYNSMKMMYFEPGQFPDTVGVDGGQVFPLGFTQPPGSSVTASVLNDHSYCCQKDPKMCATGEPSLANATECADWHRKRVGTRAADAEKLKLPLIISEFGACTGSLACA